ncbi:ankyrin repeat family protein [Tanacetum coccineum]
MSLNNTYQVFRIPVSSLGDEVFGDETMRIGTFDNTVKNRLFKAIRKDDWGKAREIVYNNTEDVTWTSKLDDSGITALHYAVSRYKNNEVVRDIVMGINSELLLTIVNVIGWHPVHVAAFFGNTENILKINR